VASFIGASEVDCHYPRISALLGAPANSLSIGLLLLPALMVPAAVLIWKRNHGREE
jgi:hypothetical protein